MPATIKSHGATVSVPQESTDVSPSGATASVTWLTLAKPAQGAPPPGGVPADYSQTSWTLSPEGPAWRVVAGYRDTSSISPADSLEVTESGDESGNRTVTMSWQDAGLGSNPPSPPPAGVATAGLVLKSWTRNWSPAIGAYSVSVTYGVAEAAPDNSEAPAADPSGDSISYSSSYDAQPKTAHPLWATEAATILAWERWPNYLAGDVIFGPPPQAEWPGLGSNWEGYIPGPKAGAGLAPVQVSLAGNSKLNLATYARWVKTGETYKVTVITKTSTTRWTKTIPDTGSAPGLPADIEAILDNGAIGQKDGDWTYMGGTASTAEQVGTSLVTLPGAQGQPDTQEVRKVWSWDINKSWERRTSEAIPAPAPSGT